MNLRYVGYHTLNRKRSDQSPEVFVPGGDFSSNQMHKDSVMGRRSFPVSLASDGPIPLDSQPGSVLGEKHLVYRDLQIIEILEIVQDRALHVLPEHVPSGRKQLSVRQPLVGSDGKIAPFPRLHLTAHTH